MDAAFPDDKTQDVQPAITPAPDSASVTALKSAASGAPAAVAAAKGAGVGANIAERVGKALLAGGEAGGKALVTTDALAGGPEDVPGDFVAAGLGIAKFIGGFAGAMGAGAGAMGAGAVTDVAQKAIMDKVAPKTEEQLSIDDEAHPIASAIGQIASSSAGFKLAPGETLKGTLNLWKMARGVPLGNTPEEVQAAKSSIVALAAQSGIGAASTIVAPLLQGQSPDLSLKDIATSTITALLYGHPHDYIENTFKNLGLPKPAADEDSGADKTTTAAGTPPPPSGIPANVLDKPSMAYEIPQATKDRLAEIAQKEAAVGFEHLPEPDVEAMQNMTANEGSPDYHQKAMPFYAQQVAIAKKARDAAPAAAVVKPDVVDAINVAKAGVTSNPDGTPSAEAAALYTLPTKAGEIPAHVVADPSKGINLAQARVNFETQHPEAKFVQHESIPFGDSRAIPAGDSAGGEMPPTPSGQLAGKEVETKPAPEPVNPSEPTPTAETKLGTVPVTFAGIHPMSPEGKPVGVYELTHPIQSPDGSGDCKRADVHRRPG